ncbi:MAG: hypothetical protein HYX78_10330, partial [Armatimonadetes bacterium]|nr:hypothetical protein [Armatimonadota bacterium]
MRDSIPKILGHWELALILLAVMGGFLAIIGAGNADKPDPTAPLDAGESSTPPQSAVTNGEPHSGKPDKLVFRVAEVLPNAGVISAFEPVIVKVEVTNIFSHPVQIYCSSDQSARIEVRDPLGRLVGDSPVYAYGETLSTDHRLPRSSTNFGRVEFGRCLGVVFRAVGAVLTVLCSPHADRPKTLAALAG